MSFPCPNYLKSYLHSFSQIMLQKNAVTGFLFLLGVGVSSPTMLLGSLLATLTGLIVAKKCQFDKSARQNGLYGFNAALAGITVLYLLPINFLSLVLVIFAGALSTLLMHLFITKLPRIPPFTMPFVLSSWLLFLLVDFSGLLKVEQSTVVFATSATTLDYLQAGLRGVAQVMLQDSWLTGAIFLCALFISSYKVAIWGAFSSVLAMLIASLFGHPQDMILMGLYSFNACLVAIALLAYYPKKPWLIILAIIVSVLLTKAFEQITLPALTAPFVITTWLMIGLEKWRFNEKKANKTQRKLT